MDHYLKANQALWNTWTDQHVNSEFYDNETFKAGKNTLTEIEMDEMGPLEGKRLLHLQCHFGQDTLSIARLGAEVTGVDFSDKAIGVARQMAEELNIPATFVCSNVLELIGRIVDPFDIVYTAYGTVGWLPDISLWGKVVAHHIKPGGTFYMAGFHPFFQMMDDKGEITYEYFHRPTPDEEEPENSYAGASHLPMKEYWWNHSLSDIINALLTQGLHMEHFHEFPYSPFNLGEHMVEVGPNRWQSSRWKGHIPYVYSLKFRKEGD